MVIQTEDSPRFHELMWDSVNDPKFHERMRQSMTVSFYKYGPVKDAYPHKVNALASLGKRLKLYVETANRDYLVDVANFAMIEFMFPSLDGVVDEPLQKQPINITTIENIAEFVGMYRETKNVNCLVGAASVAMIEFSTPTLCGSHDTPTDGGEGRYWHAGGRSTEKRNDGQRI